VGQFFLVIDLQDQPTLDVRGVPVEEVIQKHKRTLSTSLYGGKRGQKLVELVGRFRKDKEALAEAKTEKKCHRTMTPSDREVWELSTNFWKEVCKG